MSFNGQHMEHSAVKMNRKYQNKHPAQYNYVQAKEHINETREKDKQKMAKRK